MRYLISALILLFVIVPFQAKSQTRCLPYHLSGGTGANTNSNVMKNAPATICDLSIVNTSTTLGYLKLYDQATAPTCSSATNLKHVYPIPLGPSNIGAGIGRSLTFGEQYNVGIGYCVTGGGGDTDNTAGPAGIFIEGSTK